MFSGELETTCTFSHSNPHSIWSIVSILHQSGFVHLFISFGIHRQTFSSPSCHRHSIITFHLIFPPFWVNLVHSTAIVHSTHCHHQEIERHHGVGKPSPSFGLQCSRDTGYSRKAITGLSISTVIQHFFWYSLLFILLLTWWIILHCWLLNLCVSRSSWFEGTLMQDAWLRDLCYMIQFLMSIDIIFVLICIASWFD